MKGLLSKGPTQSSFVCYRSHVSIIKFSQTKIYKPWAIKSDWKRHPTLMGYLPNRPVNVRYRAGTRRDKQGQDRDKQGQGRNKQGQQGQTGTVPFCPCLSLLVHVCPCLSLSVLFYACMILHDPVSPCPSLTVLVSPCLSLRVLVCPCLSRYVTTFALPAFLPLNMNITVFLSMKIVTLTLLVKAVVSNACTPSL